MNAKRKALFYILSILFLNALCVPLSWAGLRIDKPKIRITVAAGSYDSGEIKVDNTGKESLSVKVYLEDWIYEQQDGGKVFAPKGTQALSSSNWITFYPADFKVPAGGTQIVRYTVSVPEGVKGGHFSVMFFETAGDDIDQPTGEGVNVRVKVLNRLGSLFYVEPQGTMQKTAELKNLAVDQKLNDFIVTADFINTGNTDITASGTFNVIDKEGFVYCRGEIDEVYTLPQDKAALRSVVSSTTLKPGAYDLLVTLDFQNGGSLVQEAGFTVSADGAMSSLIPKK